METVVKKPGIPDRDIPNAPNEMRKIRKERGYALGEFARMLGVSSASLSTHERENADLGTESIYRAAEILKADPARLCAKVRRHAEKIASLSADNVSQKP